MISKWYDLMPAALKMPERMEESIRFIESTLGVPRSTLTGRFKDIRLSEHQIGKLKDNQIGALTKARTHASLRKHELRAAQNIAADAAAKITLSSIELTPELVELTAAMLVWNRGKLTDATSLASSDPIMLSYFLHALRHCQELKYDAIRCELRLGTDHDIQREVNYWSILLSIPKRKFQNSAYGQSSISLDHISKPWRLRAKVCRYCFAAKISETL